MSHQRTGVAVTAIAIVNARNPLDMAWYQRFSGVARATRAVAEHRGELDPDGCLVRLEFATNRPRNRARSGVCRNDDGSRCINAISLRRFTVALDSGRLNGGPQSGSTFSIGYYLLGGHRPSPV